jgi:hypothetical protein
VAQRQRRARCPKCQGAATKEWLAEREAELLPVGYFHLVFTLPRQPRPDEGHVGHRALPHSGARGHVASCENCADIVIAYNSCRNRQSPSCGARL